MKTISEKDIERILKEDDIDTYIQLFEQLLNSNNLEKFDNILTKLLDDERSLVKLYAYDILFDKIKVDINYFRDKLIASLANKKEDTDVRIKICYILSNNYINSKDKYLLKLLYNIYLDYSEVDTLRATCFITALNLIGISTRDIVLQNKKLIIENNDINLPFFKNELYKIFTIINS